MDIFDILILVALLAVVVTLGLGFYSLYRGGEYGRANSNKFMRLRVALQAVAIVLILLGFYVHHH